MFFADVCSNWGNWVAAAGMTGGRINHFNITKQSKARGPPRPTACPACVSCKPSKRCLVQKERRPYHPKTRWLR